MKQDGSYFALQNSNWLLVGLDTAYVDHDLDAQQVAWLNLVIKESTAASGGKAKKLVLFSHQQLFSRLDTQGPKLRQALRHLLDAKAVTAWYLGTRASMCHLRSPRGLQHYGRCLGNGGIPEPREPEVLAAPTERHVGAITWKRLSATPDSPSCLALDGPNPRHRGGGTEVRASRLHDARVQWAGVDRKGVSLERNGALFARHSVGGL